VAGRAQASDQLAKTWHDPVLGDHAVPEHQTVRNRWVLAVVGESDNADAAGFGGRDRRCEVQSSGLADPCADMEAGDRWHDVKEIGGLALESVHDMRVTYGVDPVGPADVPGQVAVVDEPCQGALQRGIAMPVGQLLG